MDLHLNDWSLSCSTHLGKQRHVISQFGELTNVLRTYGIDKIVFPTNYKGINIGGIQWKDCYTPSEELTKDQWDELMAIMDKSIRKPYPEEINESRIFSNNNDFEKRSTFLGNAFFLDLPVVSFTFDNLFEQDVILGFWKDSLQTKTRKAEIKNLHDFSSIQLPSLISFKSCKKIKPEEQPLWNQVWIKKYLEIIGHQSNRKSSNHHEKISYLREHGRIIAELNGWKYHAQLSSKNSRSKIRDIFYSKEFKHKDTYLCIDLEHEDFHFELCDHKGYHLKEIHHSGKVTSDPQDHHCIRI